MRDKKYLFDHFFKPDHVSNLPPGTNDYNKIKALESTFTFMVDGLRTPSIIPNPTLNPIGELLYHLVGEAICPVGLTDAVPSLHFWAEKRQGEKSIATILVPMNWLELIRADAGMQFGAIIWVASQARDYWNNKIEHQQTVFRRSCAYEAELLRTLQKVLPVFQPNDYQQKVLEDFPTIPADLQYESRPFDLNAGPPFPIESVVKARNPDRN